MSEPREPGNGAAEGAAEEEQVRALLERSGPRPAVPPEDLAAIKRAFRAEWREHLRRRAPAPLDRHGLPDEGGRGSARAGRRSFAVGSRLLALAAALLAALGLGWWLANPAPPHAAAVLARVEAVAGAVTVRAPGEGEIPPVALALGRELSAGDEVETAAAEAGAGGHASLRLAGGPSLRLDGGSRLRLLGPSTVELAAGALYVDSGGGPGARRAVAVHTPFGVATDVGTQFEVRLLASEPAALRVRVREGEVRVERGEASYGASAGVELTLHADGSVGRAEVAPHGEAWRWAVRAAPPLAIEGRSLREFLDWTARETGWRIEYADPEVEARAAGIVLHGSIDRLTPEEAPGVVLPGAGLSHRLEDGVLLVGPAPR